MPECRECGALLDPGASACSDCGAPAMGATQSFKPVGAAEGTERDGRFAAAEGPVLIVRKGPQPGERFYLDRQRLTIGRDPESDIFLNDTTVSREHAVLEVLDGAVSVRDQESLNGTYVNSVIVDAAPLADGDVLQIGTFQMVFVQGDEDAR